MDAVRSFFAVFMALALASSTVAAYGATTVKSTDLVSASKGMAKALVAPFVNASANKTNVSATASVKTAAGAAKPAAAAKTTAATTASATAKKTATAAVVANAAAVKANGADAATAKKTAATAVVANAAAVKANGADAATAKKTAATAVVANAAAVKANGADAAIAATAIAAVAMDADTAEAIAATDASGKTTVEANEPSFADANEQNLETLEKVMVATDRSIDSAPMAGTINANGISRIAFYKSGSQYLVDAVLSPAMPLGVASRGNVETRDLTGVHFRFSNLADAASAYVMLKAFAKDSLSASYINFETQDCSPLTASGNPISCEVEGGTSGAFRVYETIR